MSKNVTKNNYFIFSKNIILTIMVVLLIPLSYTTANAQVVQNAKTPPMPKGVIVEPLNDMKVPDILKNQAKKEISQMVARGYVDSPEDVITYIDQAMEILSKNKKGLTTEKEKKNRLKPFQEIQSQLAIVPSTLNETIQVRGAMLGGVLKSDGWTGVTRFFIAPKLGMLMLEENDYIASGGGLIMIEEAINQDINGYPAILRVKKSQKGKSITELTWATDRKIYNLSLNKMAKEGVLNDFISLANSITD